MTLKLPEPTGSVWKRHRNAIRSLARGPGRRSEVVLGGGTVLAARWGHRQSIDINVLLPGRESLNDGREGGPLDLAATTGGEHLNSTRDHLLVKVEGTRLDVRRAEPELPGLEEELTIHRRAETVLASAQILRRKLRRTANGVTRDAFDIATARTAEPRALEIAINSFDETETRIICHNLRAANERMNADAAQSLTGVPIEYKSHLQDIGKTAAGAVLEHRYAHVRMDISEQYVGIQTITAGGNERCESYNARRPRFAVKHSGLDAYLIANSTLQPWELGRTLDGLNLRGESGRAFDSDDSAPLGRLAKLGKGASLTEPW